MSVWGWIAGILAGLAIVILIGYGDEDRMFSGREREAFDERTSQSYTMAPAAIGPDQSVSIVLSDPHVPAEVTGTLEEVRQLLLNAASQPPEQAKPTLQQAQEKLGAVIDTIEQLAEDTSNDATQIRLLKLALMLNKVEDLIEARLARL